MKYFFLLLLGLAVTNLTFAQGKKLTIADVEIGAFRELAPLTLQNIQWRGKTTNFTFQDSHNLYQQSAAASGTSTLFTRDELNQLLKQSGSDTVSFMPSINWVADNEFYFTLSGSWIFVDVVKRSITNIFKLPRKAANHALYYATRKIAYTIDNNLYVMGADNRQIEITRDKNPDIVNGESVSRNEFGINEGIFWSPSGNFIAYYRKDNSKVENYPLVDVTARQASLENIKYPMAGMASEHISLGIYDLASAKTVFIDKEDTISEKYLTNISWSPDEKHIYIQVLNREQNHMKLNKYLVSEGSMVKTLFEERNNRYVEPLNKIEFLKKNKNWFLYQSRRDGFQHTYIYDTEGKLVKQLTSGSWEITRLQGIDSEDNVYYMSTEGSPIESHAYKVNAVSSKKSRLTSESGMHRILHQGGFKYYIDVYSNTTTPQNIHLMQENGKLLRVLNSSPDRLSNFNMPEMSIGTIKAADGKTDLYYRLIKPTGFDPSKKYPAIIYVYGGPHTQLVQNRWLGGARLWEYMMAQKGYVMLTVDNRGSSNRGFEFESIIHRQCGIPEMQDQMEGVKLLQNLGYVDMKRLGVHGWSYGGFMVTSLMTTYPGVFKTGVAGGPVIDWKYYEVMYGERYMDSPLENPEGYQATSLIPKAKNLEGKLLIIHGAIDPTVVWQHSLVFIEECIKNQIPVDYFVYPRAEHNVRGYGRLHLMSKITAYFDDYL